MDTIMNKNLYVNILFNTFFLVCLIACSPEPEQYQYKQPEDFSDGLSINPVTEAGIDLEVLGVGIRRIQDGKYGEIHSLLIYQEGNLIVEEYFPGHEYLWEGPSHHGTFVNWDIDRRHDVASVGKSITSACIGIAIDNGFIQSVDQSIFEYLPGHQEYLSDGKDLITIEHLLTMTSGLKWDEWGAPLSNEKNDLVAIWIDCEDPVACVLERPLVSNPGTEYTYSGGNYIILGEIIKNAAGMNIESFSWEYLFKPLDITTPSWDWINETGVIYPGGSQRLSPREMLKLGITFLENGVWNDQQVITEEWVNLSSLPYNENTGIKVPGTDGGRQGYGYGWWTRTIKHKGENIDTFSASGWGGQQILVIPYLEVVVVLTGGNYTAKTYNFTILEKYILPAIQEK